MSEFKDIYLLRILHIIQYRLSIDSLVELGLAYSQIAKLLSEVIQEGLVSGTGEEGLELTEEGLIYLNKLNKELYPSNPRKWLLPSDENRVSKIDKFDVYLPKKKKV
jgi:hypothetical protein